MYASEAEYLFYYFINFSELFILKLQDYIEWFNNHYLTDKGFVRKVIHNHHFDTVGYTFSREKIRDEYFCKVIQLNPDDYL